MFQFFANIFGYLLQFLYNIVNNYGFAIILFTITVKLLLLPLSIKQQKTMKKSSELQEKMKTLQFKYKNDPEKMNQEISVLSDRLSNVKILTDYQKKVIKHKIESLRAENNKKKD